MVGVTVDDTLLYHYTTDLFQVHRALCMTPSDD